MIHMQMLKQAAQPLLRIPTGYLSLEEFNPWRPSRDKVVFIMGATGTGKSRLSIDLSNKFQAEIINSDKIQVYKGLDIVTNKVTKEEQCGIPHHLLGTVNPNLDFTAKDFCITATHAVESILEKGKLPIVVGGSNSYIESLMVDPRYGFRSRFDCCFLWVDVSVSTLYSFVSERVDKMVESGLVDEVRAIFDPSNTDYSRGIRRAIGVPELDTYFRNEPFLDEARSAKELERAINEIKLNTCKLACRQLDKIKRLKHSKGWDLNRVDATQVFKMQSKEQVDEIWDALVAKPSTKIVSKFLSRGVGPSFSAAQIATSSLIRSAHQMPVIASSAYN